jgi:hypothetical protein
VWLSVCWAGLVFAGLVWWVGGCVACVVGVCSAAGDAYLWNVGLRTHCWVLRDRALPLGWVGRLLPGGDGGLAGLGVGFPSSGLLGLVTGLVVAGCCLRTAQWTRASL